jgi:hypothetical protein
MLVHFKAAVARKVQKAKFPISLYLLLPGIVVRWFLAESAENMW